MSQSVEHNSAASRSVVYVESAWDGVRYGGTGVIVGNNDILTSAHLVHNGNLGGAADSTRISPLYEPGTLSNYFYQDIAIEYYADYDPNHDRRLITGDGLAGQFAGSEIDIALITTSENIGDIYGWMDIDFGFSSGNISVLGHPGKYGRNLIQDEGHAYQDAVDNVVMYTESPELNPGNSGGPIFYTGSDGPTVVGLVSTASAATSLAAHRAWLEAAMTENNTDPKIGAIMELGTHGSDQWHMSQPGVGYDGLSGYDTITFDLSSDEVLLSSLRDGRIELQLRGEPGTRHFFENVEELVFRDQAYRASDLSWDQSVASSVVATLAKLYVAYFDRVPDATGLEYWTAQISSGLPLEEVCRYFSLSDEFARSYGNVVQEEPGRFVTSVYENVLGRAPDLPGYQFWSEQIDTGQVAPDVFILSFIEGSAAGSPDFDYMMRRIEGSAFTVSTLTMGNKLLAEKAPSLDVQQDISVRDAYAGVAPIDAAPDVSLIGSVVLDVEI